MYIRSLDTKPSKLTAFNLINQAVQEQFCKERAPLQLSQLPVHGRLLPVLTCCIHKRMYNPSLISAGTSSCNYQNLRCTRSINQENTGIGFF